MNRRGFFGLLGKLVAVGAAMRVDSALLAPVQAIVNRETMKIVYDIRNGEIYMWRDGRWEKFETVAMYALAS
jgi:hypothetical protein